MRQLPYRVFLWVFGVSNAVVWFLILYGLGYFIQTRFAVDGHVSRESATAMLCLALVLPTVLAVQGAIVNLRVQFIGGRFLPPAAPPSTTRLRNPWKTALLTAAAFWGVGVPVLISARTVLLPTSVGTSQLARLMAGMGALVVLIVIRYAANRDFVSYARALDSGGGTQVSIARYVVGHIALPWATVNAVINGVLAWLTYHQGPTHPAATVSVAELRGDLVVMGFLISMFMALSAFPEAETDFRRNFVRLPHVLPSMPRLWTRYGYALGVGLVMHILVTATTAICNVAQIALATTVLVKGVSAAIIAGAASGSCAVWALSRCAQRHSPIALEAAAPAAAVRR
jgi:hypothetical protein